MDHAFRGVARGVTAGTNTQNTPNMYNNLHKKITARIDHRVITQKRETPTGTNTNSR